MLSYKASATLVCTIFFSNYVMSLELTELRVPLYIPLGIRADLFCHWTFGPTDVLYSVKWYKDGKEFFRYVPRDVEPLKKFQLLGVNVEKFNPSGSNLTLAPAIRASSGRYRCEVSGEGPQFQTVSKYADMFVLVLPSQGLTILGFESRYHVGDHVNASCLSNQSNPAMKLAWFINGGIALSSDRETSLGIEFTIVKSLVGDLELQCVVTVGSVYRRSIVKHALVIDTREHPEDNQVLKDSAIALTNASSGGEVFKGKYFLTASSLYFCVLYTIIVNCVIFLN